MEQHFIGYEFTVSPRNPYTDILIAELSMLEFDSFEENENGVAAYITASNWHERILDNVHVLKSEDVDIQMEKKNIEQVNWNEVWETSFDPIHVRDIVSIRAPFHPNPNLTYDIVIEPKMSFGTGHHETTHMMVEQLLETEVSDKKVLDMGCGTGILAIFAEKKGAKAVEAIDIDHWCYENSIENVNRNNCKSIAVFEGDATLLSDRKYDVILANINRNVLLNDMEKFNTSLNRNGVLILSGFYRENFDSINESAASFGLQLKNRIERNDWLSLKYLK